MFSCQLVVGGALPESATYAVQLSFFDVARMRAEPFEQHPPRFESMRIPTAAPVPNTTVAPGPTVSEVAAASFSGAPPPGPNNSTPACIGALSVDVQPKNVSSPAPPRTTPGTEYRCSVLAPAVSTGNGLSAIPACARRAASRATATSPTARGMFFIGCVPPRQRMLLPRAASRQGFFSRSARADTKRAAPPV